MAPLSGGEFFSGVVDCGRWGKDLKVFKVLKPLKDSKALYVL